MDDKKTLKFQMMMSPAEAETLDTWMFENRIRSRAEAIRRLTQIALTVEPLVAEIHETWTRIGKADGLLGNAVLDARSGSEKSHPDALIDAITEAYRQLTVPALDLAMQAAKLQAIFDALKSNKEVDTALQRVEEECKAIDRTGDWVRQVYGKPQPD